MTYPHLTIENLCCAYGETLVLDHFCLQLDKGEIAAILGPSGCGKSTLLRAIAGFESIRSGRIQLGDSLLADNSQRVPPHRRSIGMVFQDHALFPHLSVEKNIAFGLKGQPRHARSDRVSELLNMVGLPDKAQAMPHELSGGQAQRIALARALAPEPDLLLMDEPFASLDSKLRHRLISEVGSWLRNSGITALFVTHALNEADSLADRVHSDLL